MENENVAPRRSGRHATKDNVDYKERIRMKFDGRKRKRTDSHTFNETNKPHKVPKRDVNHHPTQQPSTPDDIVDTPNPPSSNIQVPPPPPVEVVTTSTVEQNTGEIVPPPPQLVSETESGEGKSDDRSLRVTIIPPPPSGGVSQTPQSGSNNINLQNRTNLVQNEVVGNSSAIQPSTSAVVGAPKLEGGKRRKKKDSDEEYQFEEEEENPEDYMLEVKDNNFYYSNPRMERARGRKKVEKAPDGGEYVPSDDEEDESSESIEEEEEVLEEGELEDIKRINQEMIEMEAIAAANKGLPPPLPFDQASGTASLGDEDTGGDSNKKYNFRRRRVDPRRKVTELGTFYLPDKTPEKVSRTPFDKYDKLERKRKKKNAKIKKMMRKARKNVPLSPLVKIGDTTSSDDEKKDESNVSRFLRTGGPQLQPNSYSRIAPLNRGVESRRLGFKPPRADVDPVAIDKSITWDSIGGLKEHIIKLKEMVILPLLYPDVYTNLGIKPPRGVLFVGPPGTGKTLTARALCNMCRVTEQKEIAFFMRKGADILSKWVGEAEKQLRMLFERARELQPSIIFFDEIDGLAPVRSSKQDYIHTSIVSTLLALMDGLDDRGKVVVIGATNRADAVDPALRRPGRFDRELFFPLPDEKERKEILDIHTKNWKIPVPEEIKLSLAKRAVGFCGADLKSLCTETGLKALRRRYPQIYSTTDRLRINVKDVKVTKEDWESAFREMRPSYYKTREFYPQPLSVPLKALFKELTPNLENLIRKVFPVKRERHGGKSSFVISGGLGQAEEDPEQEAFWREMGVKRESKVGGSSDSSDLGKLMIYRPSVMIFGRAGNGQTNLLKALLHSPQLEYFRVFHLSLETLFDPERGGGYTMEERLISKFKEIRSNSPCILAIPSFLDLWNNVSVTARNLLVQSIKSLPANLPILIISSVEVPKFEDNIQLIMEDEEEEIYSDSKVVQKEGNEKILMEKERVETRNQFLSIVPNEVMKLFRHQFQIMSPDKNSRTRFFKLITRQVKTPILISNLPTDDNKEEEDEVEEDEEGMKKRQHNGFEVDEERKKKLMKRLLKEEKGYIDQLLDCLYRICNTLLSDRHFKSFHRPQMEKPRLRRGRPKKKKEFDFIVDEDEELEYEEDILENNDPDAEYVPRKRAPPPPPPPPPSSSSVASTVTIQLGVNQQQVPGSETLVPPPIPEPIEKIYLYDILARVNAGEFGTAREFLRVFEVFRDHGEVYENFRTFVPGYGRTGGYGGSVAEDEEKWKRQRLIEAGKNLYKRVEISLQTIDRALLKECKRIAKRRKRRKEMEENSKKEAEEKERIRLLKEEEERKKQNEMFPPLRRMTRGFLKKLDETPEKKKKSLKIKIPKMVQAVLPRGELVKWERRILEKTKGWNVEKLEVLYSRMLREISKFKWQPKRSVLLQNLERIVDEERVR